MQWDTLQHVLLWWMLHEPRIYQASGLIMVLWIASWEAPIVEPSEINHQMSPLQAHIFTGWLSHHTEIQYTFAVIWRSKSLPLQMFSIWSCFPYKKKHSKVGVFEEYYIGYLLKLDLIKPKFCFFYLKMDICTQILTCKWLMTCLNKGQVITQNL